MGYIRLCVCGSLLSCSGKIVWVSFTASFVVRVGLFRGFFLWVFFCRYIVGYFRLFGAHIDLFGSIFFYGYCSTVQGLLDWLEVWGGYD